MADGEGHCQKGQSKGQRDTQKPDSQIRKSRGQYHAATAAQNEPKSPQKFSSQLLSHRNSPIIVFLISIVKIGLFMATLDETGRNLYRLKESCLKPLFHQCL
jgi:hypothetical protein